MEPTKKKSPTKKNGYANWKILGLLIGGLLLGSIVWSAFFLYEYAYTTLNNTNAIIILNSTLGANVVDNKSFVAAQNAIQQKKGTPETGTKLRNIFYYAEETTTNTSSVR